MDGEQKKDSAEVLSRFHDNLELVRIVVAQIRREFGTILQYEEMVSFAQEGLLIAARRFESERGVSFRNYAYYRVRGSVIDGIRSHGPLSRRAHEKVKMLQAANLVSAGFFDDQDAQRSESMNPEQADERLANQLSVLATAMAIGFCGESVPQGDGHREVVVHDRADDTVEHNQLMTIVYQELKNLPKQEETLIRRHFFNDEDIDEISADLGLSKSWGSRLVRRGLTKIAKRLEARV